jgi:hypothetical protein
MPEGASGSESNMIERIGTDGTPSSSNTGSGQTINAHDGTSGGGWAKIWGGFILSGIKPGPFKLLCYLDLRAGDQGYESFGYAYIAERIGVQEDTVSRWAKELQAMGLIDISGEPKAKQHLSLIYNPSRELYPESGEIPTLPPIAECHHPKGSRATPAKRSEMERITQHLKSRCDDTRESGQMTPEKQGSESRKTGALLVLASRYGLGLDDSSGEGSGFQEDSSFSNAAGETSAETAVHCPTCGNPISGAEFGENCECPF